MNAPLELLRLKLQVLLGNMLIAVFGLYIAFVYAVPYVMPEVRALQQPSGFPMTLLRYRNRANTAQAYTIKQYHLSITAFKYLIHEYIANKCLYVLELFPGMALKLIKHLCRQ